MIHLDKSEYWMGGAKFPNKTNGKFHLKATNFLWKKNFIYHRNSIHVFYATVFMNIYRYDCTHLMCIGIYIILNHECYPWDHGNMGCISEAYIIDSTCYKNLLDGTIKKKKKSTACWYMVMNMQPHHPHLTQKAKYVMTRIFTCGDPIALIHSEEVCICAHNFHWNL